MKELEETRNKWDDVRKSRCEVVVSRGKKSRKEELPLLILVVKL